MDHNGKFPATPWTLLDRAVRGDDGPEAEAAINTLCQNYWYPLYAFARRTGCSHENAQDQTQIFLSRLTHEKKLLAADASKGRLRSFLLTAFQRQLINSWQYNRAARRGGGLEPISLDMSHADQRFAHESPDPGMSPSEQFDKSWAEAMLDACLAVLAAKYAARGQADEFAGLRPFLSLGSAGNVTTLEIAARLGVPEGTIRQRVARLRADFARSLREHVAGSLANPDGQNIDEELHSLRDALRR